MAKPKKKDKKIEIPMLNYTDVLKVFNEIKANLINVEDIDGFQLDTEEVQKVDEILGKVIKRFKSIDQELNQKHVKYVKDILTILVKGLPSSIPDLIPLIMGGGKSLIIEEFVINMVQTNPEFGAIVVKERIVDVDAFAEKINNKSGKEVAYALHGFDKNNCEANEHKCTYHKCNYNLKCKYYNQINESKKYPIVAITHVRLGLDNERNKLCENFGVFCDEDGVIHERTKLLIDERPQFIYSESISNIDFDDIVFWMANALDSLKEDEHDLVTNELNKAFLLAKEHLAIPDKQRKSLVPIDNSFRISEETKRILFREFGYGSDYIKIPYLLESLIRYGGHAEKTYIMPTLNERKKKKLSIIYTSHYKKSSYPLAFHTVIFDGTADIDLTYRHKNYRIFNFEPIRSYSNLNFYTCNLLKSSKTALEPEEMLIAFCNEVKKIADENPDKKIYLVVYKEIETIIATQLKEYTESQIKIAHFGATKGSNEFLDCDITILGGIVHKTESYYIGLFNAVYDSVTSDLNCKVIQKKRRFNNLGIEKLMTCDMLVDISQEIKRGSQRDNTRDVKGDVYLFSNNELLLDLANYKFPSSKRHIWNPMFMADEKLKQKANHSQVKHHPILIKCLTNFSSRDYFTTSDIISETGIPKQVLSSKLADPLVTMVIARYGFEKIKNPKDRRQDMYIKKVD